MTNNNTANLQYMVLAHSINSSNEDVLAKKQAAIQQCHVALEAASDTVDSLMTVCIVACGLSNDYKNIFTNEVLYEAQ